MTMQRWEPFKEVVSLRNAMDRLFEDSFVRTSMNGAGGETEAAIALDMYQTDKDLVVKASLAGFEPDEVDISISGDNLYIKGEHEEDKETEEENYYYRERHYGSVSRVVPIPVDVKSDKAEATFDNGVLTLVIPKAEESKPKQIKVRAKPKAIAEQKKEKTAK
jgi:HSP20 family protein